MTWEDVAADKKARIANSIPAEWKINTDGLPDSVFDVPGTCGLLTPTELEITKSSGVDLVAKLATGQLKSVDVTLSFCKRAAIAHQLVSILYPFDAKPILT